MSAVLSLLRSRLLRPVFVALGIALLVQVLVAVALTRSTVTALEADLGERLGTDSRKLASELEQAGQEVRSGLDSLSSSTRQRLSAGLSTRLQNEQQQLRTTLEKNLKDSANDMAELLASVAPRAIWDNDVPVLSDFARRAQRNPNVLFVVYDDAQGQHLTRYLNRQNPINQALMDKGQGERALDKVINAARQDPAVYFVEASINPNGAEIGKVVMGVSTAGIDQELKALDQRFAALIASGEQLVGDSLVGAAADSGKTLRERLEKAQGSAAAMQANTAQTVRDAAAELRWRIGLGLVLVNLFQPGIGAPIPDLRAPLGIRAMRAGQLRDGRSMDLRWQDRARSRRRASCCWRSRGRPRRRSRAPASEVRACREPGPTPSTPWRGSGGNDEQDLDLIWIASAGSRPGADVVAIGLDAIHT